MIKLSEIEKYYNGEIHVDFDDEIEELKAVERDNRELRKEIEKQNNIITELLKRIANLEREVEKYEGF